ncbi:MAG: DUF3108 domain-containing protein [Alphaproteobacteria bacterium]
MAKHWILPALLFAASACIGGANAAQVGQRISLSYNLYAAGLPVAELDAEVELTGSSYRVASDLRTVGLADMRVGWRAAQVSDGRLVNGSAHPSRFASDGTWRDQPRRTEIKYSAAGAVDLDLTPSADDDLHPPVSPAQRAGTVDFMSAMVELTFADSPAAACAGSRAIFDGRRRYDMVLVADREETLPKLRHNIYAGTALRCRVELRRVAGFAAEADGFEVPETLYVWLARDAGSGLVMPVKLQAATGFGTAEIHLSRVTSDDFRQAGLAN